MNTSQQNRFKSLYQKHVKALVRQGKAKATVDAYSRAVRRIAEYFDRCPDRLSIEDLKDTFQAWYSRIPGPLSHILMLRGTCTSLHNEHCQTGPKRSAVFL